MPYVFQYGDDVLANTSVLFDLDSVIAKTVARRLDYVNWFNSHYGVCVMELVLYTPYSDLLTQVASVTDTCFLRTPHRNDSGLLLHTE